MIAATLEARYAFVRPLDDGRFEVVDRCQPGLALVATLHGMPRAAARIAEELALLSWLRHPGLVLPHDLFLDDSGIWSVTRPPPGVPARDASPAVDDVLRWGDALCELLEALQRAPRRAVSLRALGPDSVRVSAERRVLLTGFELDGELRLAHRGGAWQAPDGDRAEVWLVGRFLADLLERAPRAPDPRLRSLRALVRRSLDPDPRARPRSLFLLRRGLARIAALPAPAPSRARRVGPRALVAACLAAGLLWGLAGVVAVFPVGDLGGVEGVVAGAETLVSPGGHRCVAWSARVVRVLERQTWDAEARAYRVLRYERVLVDRAASAPFTLGGRPLGRVSLEGSAAPLTRLPEGVDDRLRPGEHVIANHGYEVYIRVGEVAHLHDASDSQAEGIVRQGTRMACAARAAWAALPWLLLTCGCAGGLAALWRKGRLHGRA